MGGSASICILPLSSDGTRTTRSRPNPSRLNAFNTLPWTCSPTTTVILGAPYKPFASTSQSNCCSIDERAAASAQKLAIVTPVTNPTEDPSATGKISVSHFSVIDSILAFTGLVTSRPAFWSHALASQCAAKAEVCVPPITKPKYRPAFDVTVAGEPNWCRNSTVSIMSFPSRVSGSSKALKFSSAFMEGPTERDAASVR